MAVKKIYKHVLVAVDLSKHSEKIVARASQIATANRAKLSIVHTLQHAPIAYGGEFSIPIDVEFNQTMQKQAKKHLCKIAKKYHITDRFQFLENGSVHTAVNQVAKKMKADLIVIGAHEHHGLGMFLGSQANAILHGATRDVLVVRL
ncbi:MAG: hypothetical protein ACD_42C00579G0001 [uncultured bacterium]|nr:MAG: hypothetical protein ACD_42C00579G0001 [uncultured bacterium]OGT25774.1 MAG: hypothetical protein A3B71_01395 [Gammaproteobacteria bacterium RIFCSPHIGHO2_02_FULL_42_43]OGT51722.1 MAG: hypothetical protein A3E54_03610 [Gammaproteobacteria bacterium RIFCSPHIGHO2_12_FULL_41_25]OGT61619.1 MAG: hypothetical protein A3I77_03415 [Gammaproteobacteria bacterium RIFCSPLOWO2_02_FULL_42_14]OGT86243.1 MAG: hypothetical protein A3G86_06265 [Gammaproteobacteria bacterium RIFCSPLOWO2_12_FULL_42_18]